MPGIRVKEKVEMKDYLKLSLLVGSGKRTIIPVIIIALMGFQIMTIFIEYYQIVKSQDDNSEIVCVTNDRFKDKKELKNIKGVKYASEYVKLQKKISLEGFTAEVTIYGEESEYLQMKYQNEMVVRMDSVMPYVLIDERMLSLLKDNKGRKIELESIDSYILKTVQIGEEIPVTARICGIIEDNREEQSDVENLTVKSTETATELGVYTSLEGIKKLAGTDMVEQSEQIIIYIENHRNISDIILKIEKAGFTVEKSEQLAEGVNRWNRWKNTSYWQVVSCVSLFLCVGVILYYQDKKWLLDNKAFAIWLIHFDKKHVHRVFLLKNMGIIIVGLLSGYTAFKLLSLVVSQT